MINISYYFLYFVASFSALVFALMLILYEFSFCFFVVVVVNFFY